MICLPQINNCVDILTFKHNQVTPFPINCGISVTVQLQYLDTDQEDGNKSQRHIHRMLRVVKGGSWKDHMTNQELYADLPGMHLAGDCLGHSEERASKLLTWQPTEGRVNRGRKPTGYINNIKRTQGWEA